MHLYDNGVINLDMALKSFELDGVVVLSDDPDRNVRNPISGVAKLSAKELKAIPAFMGEADIFKGLQMMPGVSSVGEGTSGINVRGAKTDQNLILMNEAVVLSSNHALGFLSSFNTEVVQEPRLTSACGQDPWKLGRDRPELAPPTESFCWKGLS